MDSIPSPAQELVLIDRELALLDSRRAMLLARRAWLVDVLGTQAARPGGAAGAAGAVPGGASGWAGTDGEASAWGVRTVLLALGGALLVIAALAFTLLSWGVLGIGGRTAVLGAVTVVALAVPAVLLRRGLRATAETVAALALALTVLDAWALYLLAGPWAWGASGYTAAAAALLAVLWTGYGLAFRGLRAPLPAAVVLGQFPVTVAVVAFGGDARTVAWVLLATGAADALPALRARSAAVRVTAWSAAGVTAGYALLTSFEASLRGGVEPALLLLAGAALGVAVGWRVAGAGAVACAMVAAAAWAAAGGGLLRAVVPAAWAWPTYAACASLLILAVAAAPAVRVVPQAVRRGLVWASDGIMGLGLLVAVPLLIWVQTALVPDVWAGAALEGPGAEPAPVWPAVVTVALVGGVLASGASVPAGVGGPGVRVAARCGALGLGALAAWTVPVAAGLPYGAVLAAHLLVVAALLAVAVRPTRVAAGLEGAAPGVNVVAASGFGCAVAAAAGVAVAGLATRAATLVVLAALALLWTGASAAAGSRPWLRAASACGAVAAAAGFTGAAGAAAGWPAHWVGAALLAVPAATACLGARLRHDAAAVPVEGAGAAVGAVAVALSAGRPGVLALVLGLAGVVAAGTALRKERLRVAGPLAALLLVAAAWVRLALWDVTVPEAYALPVAVPALVVGALGRKREAGTGSWAAYGPGLAAGLLPSLCADWGDADSSRPLLLGAVALAVTLGGARRRLQAPLLLGGGVLLLVALHELAPYVAAMVGVLPRWLPPALAGLLLLMVGATYERRLRELRRLRDAVGRMG
ncbi:SCO7613 C-terminal domain-containing membrane protein [Streptomyces sp. SudanB25_2051]|uniref:SCO7613 C-terminal domain-containing membrane protein n=1 Tax=Streptomyces sp. SudanB25_2051 TaxID=3035275 RepID=UPI003F554272